MSEIKTKVASCDNCEHQKECLEKPPCILDAYQQGRADERARVVEEIKGLAQYYLIGMMSLENTAKYGNKNAEQQDISYGSLMRYEIADCVDDFMDGVERLLTKQ